MKQFIVTEISKSWQDGRSESPGFIGEQFEHVINHNAKRGYRLSDFKFHQVVTGEATMIETIVAVFELVGEK